MPSNKIITIMILCLAVVLSIWIISKKGTSNPLSGVSSVNVERYRNVTSSDDAWKKILTTLHSGPSTTSPIVIASELTPPPEDTTLTAQMAKDLFSGYLLSTKVGEFNSNIAEQIASNVLVAPQYSETTGAVYVQNNLNVVGNDNTSKQQYKTVFMASLKNKLSLLNVLQDPMYILSTASQTEDEKALAGLDPIIQINQAFIGDLLKMSVPKSAVKVHLEVLNAASNTLTDLQGMRQAFVDPVKSLAAMGEYELHLDEFIAALGSMNDYFEEI